MHSIRPYRLLSFLLIVVLGACQACPPKTLSANSIEPHSSVYKGLDKHAYLKGKILVGEWTYSPSIHLPYSPDYTRAAVADTLSNAGFLARSYKTAPYILKANVVSITRSPFCSLSTCITFAEIDYTLTDRHKHIVYQDTIISPHAYPGVLVTPGCQGNCNAVKNNIIELLYDLNDLTKADLRGHRVAHYHPKPLRIFAIQN